jgi:hypothetical protein
LLDPADPRNAELLADTAFVRLRWQGVIALFRSHLGGEDSGAWFAEAVARIREAQELFGGVLTDPEFAVHQIADRVPDARFNPLFLDDPLQVGRWWTEHEMSFRSFFHLSPETVPLWEARVLELDPAGALARREDDRLHGERSS